MVLIEDKIGSIEHSDQLSRYKDYVINSRGIVPDKVIALYTVISTQLGPRLPWMLPISRAQACTSVSRGCGTTFRV